MTLFKSDSTSQFLAIAMYESFNRSAIKVATLAQKEARRSDHNFVGSEQILLGLIQEDTGNAAQVLKSMGITQDSGGCTSRRWKHHREGKWLSFGGDSWHSQSEKYVASRSRGGSATWYYYYYILLLPSFNFSFFLNFELGIKIKTYFSVLSWPSIYCLINNLHDVLNYLFILRIKLHWPWTLAGGLLRDGGGVATCVLMNLRADPSKIRWEVCKWHCYICLQNC